MKSLNRSARTAAWFAGVVLLGALISALPAQKREDRDDQDEENESRVRRGFEIAPVPLNLGGKNHALVGLGSYLVNAPGSCNSCHTCPSYKPGDNHNPFRGGDGQINAAGYLAGGVPFGPFTSRNITPDASGKPAGFTFEQFQLVMRTGIDLDHEHPQISPLLQVMPWPNYAKMTDRDLRAMYEYLSAIQHADEPPRGTCTGADQ